MEGMSVTRDYFRLLGIQPVLGRTFLESETGFPPAPVVMPPLGTQLKAMSPLRSPAMNQGSQCRCPWRATSAFVRP